MGTCTSGETKLNKKKSKAGFNLYLIGHIYIQEPVSSLAARESRHIFQQMNLYLEKWERSWGLVCRVHLPRNVLLLPFLFSNHCLTWLPVKNLKNKCELILKIYSLPHLNSNVPSMIVKAPSDLPQFPSVWLKVLSASFCHSCHICHVTSIVQIHVRGLLSLSCCDFHKVICLHCSQVSVLIMRKEWKFLDKIYELIKQMRKAK